MSKCQKERKKSKWKPPRSSDELLAHQTASARSHGTCLEPTKREKSQFQDMFFPFCKLGTLLAFQASFMTHSFLFVPATLLEFQVSFKTCSFLFVSRAYFSEFQASFKTHSSLSVPGTLLEFQVSVKTCSFLSVRRAHFQNFKPVSRLILPFLYGYFTSVPFNI